MNIRANYDKNTVQYRNADGIWVDLFEIGEDPTITEIDMLATWIKSDFSLSSSGSPRTNEIDIKSNQFIHHGNTISNSGSTTTWTAIYNRGIKLKKGMLISIVGAFSSSIVSSASGRFQVSSDLSNWTDIITNGSQTGSYTIPSDGTYYFKSILNGVRVSSANSTDVSWNITKFMITA